MIDALSSYSKVWTLWFVGLNHNRFPGNTLIADTLADFHLSAEIGTYKNFLLSLFDRACDIAKIETKKTNVKHLWINQCIEDDIQSIQQVAKKRIAHFGANDKVVCINAALCPVNTETFVGNLAKGLATPLNSALVRFAYSRENAHTLSQLIFQCSSNNSKNVSNESQIQTIVCPYEDFYDWYQSDEAVLIFNSQLTSRHFNSIIQGRSGYFVKKSSQKTKIKAEHTYLTNLPTTIRAFFPAVWKLC